MANVEDIKKESQGLRGTIRETLESDATHLEDADVQILKFHGTYQYDDRDARKERRKAGLDKDYRFMVRSRIPGGRITSQTYLIHDRLACELGSGTVRITSRQGLQLHGVVKGDLKSAILQIQRSGITNWGACGDVVRNVMAPSWPLDTPVHRDARQLAQELADMFAAKTRAVSEIWLDGEKMGFETTDASQKKDVVVDEEPIYGETYLPRKFKIGIAIPPRNDIDVFTQDIGLIPYAPNGRVEGYTMLVGGGLGMTHNKEETFPILSQPLFYVPREHVVDVAKAVVIMQRDHGERDNRRRARMKYLIVTNGIDWVREQVRARMPAGIDVEPPKPVQWGTVEDMVGWHEQGDGKLFVCAYVPQGRIADTDEGRYLTAFRTIAEEFGFPIGLTPNCNFFFHDIDPAQKDAVERILREHDVLKSTPLTRARKMSHACVALPTCSLALSEAERAFSPAMDRIDEVLRELNLQDEPILFRMTGCPNGCARPYNADFGFVGRAKNRYALFVGGSCAGDQLAGLERKTVLFDDIADTVRGYLEEFVEKRKDGETFGAFWSRTHTNGAPPHPSQFHHELEKREKRLAKEAEEQLAHTETS